MADDSLLNDSNLATLGSNDDEAELLIEDDYLKGSEMQIDPELEAIKARVKEMEEEAEKLKQLQSEVTKQMTLGSPTGSTPMLTAEEKAEVDNRSIYVGNVDYGATAEELEAHFHGCGAINRVTILCNKADGHPKGFAYIEFGSKEFVETALAMNETLFRGRQIKIIKFI
uniref:RRM domain-containing protein n=1 Tax=Anopheles merus TaxID=30066 RepID=A0A182VFY8_ANOME